MASRKRCLPAANEQDKTSKTRETLPLRAAGELTVICRSRKGQLPRLRQFALRVQNELKKLGLKDADFDVTLTDNPGIARLNREFRGKDTPTDVLSFPWRNDGEAPEFEGDNEMAGFLGDIVISVETARCNAAAERHSLETEIRQLILHGALHLAGYDHAIDQGEMNEVELRLRRSLGIEGL